MEIAADPEARHSAAKPLAENAYPVSNRVAHATKPKTWRDIVSAAGHADAFLPNVDLLYDVAGALWQAGYRSIDGYLSIARQQMTLEHGNLPSALLIHFKRVSRAAARGRGPARHAAELAFLRLREIPLIEDPGGPCHARRMSIIASWWLLREIEASNLTLDCVTLSSNSTSILLPASKADSRAHGTTRSLGCSCSSSGPDLCPFHLLQAQVDFARERSLALASGSSRPDRGAAPLLPAVNGKASTKMAVSASVVEIARLLGLQTHTISGAPRFTGHTFRATGAIHLASCGIGVWRIQLHGRWGSDAILRYIKLAPLYSSLAVEAALGRDLKSVREALTSAKAELAALSSAAPASDLQRHVDTSLGQLSSQTGPLGPVQAEDMLSSHTKGWYRKPIPFEHLVQIETSGSVHAFRPPVRTPSGFNHYNFLAAATDRTAFCGWKFSASGVASSFTWSSTDAELGRALCRRCFGRQPAGEDSSTSDSESQ